MVGVEEAVRHGGSGDLLELLARVEDQLTRGAEDREGAGAEGVELGVAGAIGAQPGGRADLKATEVGVTLQSSGGRGGAERCGAVLAEALDPLWLHIVAPLAGIALVRGDQVGLTGNGVGGHRIGHEQPVHRNLANVDRVIAIRGIDAAPGHRVIDRSERKEVRDLGRRDVDDGEGVGLLQRHPGGESVIRKRHVLRLEVARDAQVLTVRELTKDPDAVGQLAGSVSLVGVEVGDPHGGLRRCLHRGGQVHHTDRPLGVNGVVICRLTLVGHDGTRAVLGDRDHVRKRTDLHGAEARKRGGVEEGEPAVGDLVRALYCHH